MSGLRDVGPEISGRRKSSVLDSVRLRLAGSAPRLAMVVVAAYLYVWRQPLVLTAPTLWAEDGSVFFKDALGHSLSTLFRPDHGQIWLFQRVVAFGAALMPVSILPAVYATAAVAVAVFSCSIVLSSRWRFSVPLSARFLCMLALLCSPGVDEVYGTLSDSHWWMAIGLVLLGMLSDPISRRVKAGELAFTASTALSGFAAIYAIPVLAVRAFRNRSRHSLGLLGVALSGLLVQVGCLLNSARQGNLDDMLQHPIKEVTVLIRRVFADSAMGDTNLVIVWSNRLPDLWVWLVPLAVIVALVVVWIRAPRMEAVALLMALIGGWLLAMWVVADVLDQLWYFSIGGRYFLVPIAILYVSLTTSWPDDILGKGVAGLAVVLFGAGVMSGYHLDPLPRVDWAPFASCVERRVTTCTTVIPPGWTLEVNPSGS
jgi:hypothetical protein